MPAQRRAVAEIDLHGRIGTRIAQGVDAGAAVERIATGPTFEGVVAKPAAQDIGAGKVAQDVVAVATDQRVVEAVARKRRAARRGDLSALDICRQGIYPVTKIVTLSAVPSPAISITRSLRLSIT